ncbi:hypothetical protein [Hymenobacter jejuensis]|uniref:Uncharacterized protein n=2 Tax=Hymenobacter TaxID=89966 RepID=A0A5B8A3A2_9BACT|nr:hypothetical protein [Hymenobacter jejuensis]QDA61800.1 hypothetical protein FHG12_17615 [Hymenobacter jejuensis]
MISLYIEERELRRFLREQTPQEMWTLCAPHPSAREFNSYFWDVYLPASKWKFVLKPMLWPIWIFN